MGPDGAFTWEMVLRPDSAADYNLGGAATEFQMLMQHSKNDLHLKFNYLTNGNVHLALYNDVQGTVVNQLLNTGSLGINQYATNEWFHLAVTYDGNSAGKVYWTKLSDDSNSPANELVSFSMNDFELIDATLAFAGVANLGGKVFNGAIDEIRISSVARADDEFLQLVVETVTAFPALSQYVPAPNLIPNGEFDQVSGLVGTPDVYNIINSFGDYANFHGSTATVTDWGFEFTDPNDLRLNIGTAQQDDSGLDPVPVLDGTWYLDTLVDTALDVITLNSSMSYRNGITQVNALSLAAIDSGKTYAFSVDANGLYDSNGVFTAALTDGSGTPIAGGSLTGTVDTWSGVQTIEISGDLLDDGQVDVMLDQMNTTAIDNYPNGAVNPNDITAVSQIQIHSVSLFELITPEAGDLNRDGVVDQADVDLANSYLDGSIDGGEDAATRQADLVAGGMSAANALIYLNLTALDFDGDNTFDSNDVVVLEGLVPAPPALPVIDSGSLDGSGNFVVQVSGLEIGTEYFLMKDTNLGDGAVFDVVADSVTAASTTETLTDDNAQAESDQAFYKVTYFSLINSR
jgi:hypothetical protein